MPIKMGKKKYASFAGAVAAKEREGYSHTAATKIVGSIESKQHPKARRKKR